MVTSDYMPEKLRVQLKEEGVELLSGQWSYAPNEILMEIILEVLL